jgi:hypothetical protein
MSFRSYLSIFIFIFFTSCITADLKKNKPNVILENNFTNKGFALVYNENLFINKIVTKKIGERELIIFQKNLKKGTQVKITNILNNKYLIAKVGKKSDYPSFNNAVISIRIAQELFLNVDEPYIEIISIPENSLFVAKKAKIYDEEKSVANKVPVKTISINNLNVVEIDNKKNSQKNFSYLIKIADFYFNKTASIMVKRIKTETLIKNPKIKKITDKKYRVYLGPFDNINSLQKSFNDINILEFENIEIIKND